MRVAAFFVQSYAAISVKAIVIQGSAKAPLAGQRRFRNKTLEISVIHIGRLDCLRVARDTTTLLFGNPASFLPERLHRFHPGGAIGRDDAGCEGDHSQQR